MTKKDAKVIGELADSDAVGLLGINMAESGDAIGVYGETKSEDGYGLYTPNDGHVGGTMESKAVSTEQGRFDGSPWVDVSVYGAEGDGNTNDTNAIEDAIEAAGDGGTIFVPKGTYLVDYGELFLMDHQTLTLHSDATFKADEQTVEDPSEVDGKSLIEIKGEAGDRIEGVTIEGGMFDGNKDNVTVDPSEDTIWVESIDFDEASDCTVKHVDGVDAVGDHINARNSDNLTVINCDAENAGGHNVHWSSGTENCSSIACHAENCGFDDNRAAFDINSQSKQDAHIGAVAVDCHVGFDLRGENGTVKGCRAIGCGDGFDIRETESLEISASWAIGSEKESGQARNWRIRADASNVELDGCWSVASTRNGWDIEGSDVTLNGCHSKDDARVGISVQDDADTVKITGCESRDVNDFQTLTVQGGADNVQISDTTLINPGSDALAIRADDTKASGMTFKDVGGIAVSVEDAATEVQVEALTFDNVSTKFDTEADVERLRIDGWGENDGDPSSTGEWNGHGREGVAVVDTTNNDKYVYRGGVWV